MRYGVAISPFHTVIEFANIAGHGTYESEVAACVVFAGLQPDRAEVRANAPLLAICAQ